MKTYFGIPLKANAAKMATSIAMIYAVIAWVWIIASDSIILWMTNDPRKVLQLEFYYENLFVIVSALLLRQLIKSYFAWMRREDEKLMEIAQGISVASGETFFTGLARHLARALDYDYAIIGEFIENQPSLKIRAAYARGELRENISIPVAGTPLQAIRGTRHPLLCPANAEVMFPGLRSTITDSIQGIFAVPIINAAAQVTGAIVMMNHDPLGNAELSKEIVPIFAVRCAVELDRLATEQELAERHFRELLENVQFLAVILDAKGTLVYCNGYFLERTGLHQAEAIHRNWFDLVVPAEAREKLRAEFETKTAAGTLLPQQTYEIITKTGTRQLIKWNRILLRDRNGELTRIASIGLEV